ncbi:hypothetical protein C7S13_3995 [Burkholderia cepacia]|nr:hypothetical protein [Burkholderia cepacia]
MKFFRFDYDKAAPKRETERYSSGMQSAKRMYVAGRRHVENLLKTRIILV